MADSVLKVRVTAASADCTDAPVSLDVPRSSVPATAAAAEGTTPCQVQAIDDKTVRLTWMVRDLKRGDSREYRLVPAPAKPGAGVEVRRDDADVEIVVAGKRFARYDTTTGPTKPYLHPVYAPNGKLVVRGWPVAPADGETKDHPHHRGIWFTHGELNGVDFWTEGPGKGRTVHQAYDALESGPIYGRVVARTQWVGPAGGAIAEDVREMRVYSIAAGTVLDFDVTVTPSGGGLEWGDTKEGLFGLRVADSMRVKAGGSLLNSAGNRDTETWGKAASWCAYWGKVDGETVGFIVCDHPQNLRHPTPWSARDYGMLTANPFGLHDFYPAHKDEPNAGRHETAAGEEIRFRYRVLIHTGTSPEVGPDRVFNDYAEPPRVELAASR